MSRYGVLLVGGNRTHQETYGRVFASDPRCRVVGVTHEPGVSTYRDALDRMLAAEMNAPFVEELDRALAREDVHIVSVCIDVERRGVVAQRCALAGKHLYLDKPLAGSVADAIAIADAVERMGVRSQMFSFVTSPWARRAKQASQAGRVGRILGVHADMLMAKGRPGAALPGQARREGENPERFTFIEAKREMFDMGVYSVSLVQWVSERRVKTVQAVTGNYFFSEHAAAGVEDFGALLMELEDGAIATATGGRIGWTSHPRSGLARVVLVGERGALLFSESEPHVEVYNDDPPFTMPPRHPFDPMGMWASSSRDAGVPPKRQWVPLEEASAQETDIKRFLDCLDQGLEPEMNARRAVHHVEALMAGYRSAARREPVSIPLPC